jgi:hypothetical protein
VGTNCAQTRGSATVAVRGSHLSLLARSTRALLAQAHGDEASYRDYRDRYRAMANDLGFEGHIATAAAMYVT